MDVIEKINIALRANGGDNMANCQCESGDQLTPPFHCEFCAIRSALLEARRHLTTQSNRPDDAEHFFCARCGGRIKHGKNGQLIPIFGG